jgi:hypothetical protein
MGLHPTVQEHFASREDEGASELLHEAAPRHRFQSAHEQ